MIDRFNDPLLTPRDVARHLRIPPSTLYDWLRDSADGEALVHRVVPQRRGWPSIPFVAVVEAYVLRSLRALRLTKRRIREAAAEVRRTFDTPSALATKKIMTDGVDIFIEHAPDDIARASDGQRPIREVIEDYLHCIHWESMACRGAIGRRG